jgi:hypothetical protein
MPCTQQEPGEGSPSFGCSKASGKITRQGASRDPGRGPLPAENRVVQTSAWPVRERCTARTTRAPPAPINARTIVVGSGVELGGALGPPPPPFENGGGGGGVSGGGGGVSGGGSGGGGEAGWGACCQGTKAQTAPFENKNAARMIAPARIARTRLFLPSISQSPYCRQAGPPCRHEGHRQRHTVGLKKFGRRAIAPPKSV